ncbi:MAG TPA: P83/100 family protein [Spirochaetia bacterium]|nr:P83/100 family protein [Spirochaetia bacterium]
MTNAERVSLGCRRLLLALFLCAAAAGAWSQQLNTAELGSTAGRTFQFRSYTGPQPVVESVPQISGIGEVLSRAVRTGGTEGTYFGKYSVIRAFQPGQALLGADIIVLGPRAQIDDIRNVQRIVAGYLAAAFGYDDAQSERLAAQVMTYNAAYRGNVAALAQKYTPLVMSHVTAENAGISLNYAEWPGKTRLLIPLDHGVGGPAAGSQGGTPSSAAATAAPGSTAQGSTGTRPAGTAAASPGTTSGSAQSSTGSTARPGSAPQGGATAAGNAAAGNTTEGNAAAGNAAAGNTTPAGAAPAGSTAAGGATPGGSAAPGTSSAGQPVPAGGTSQSSSPGGSTTGGAAAPSSSASPASGQEPGGPPALFGIVWWWWLVGLAALVVLAGLVFLAVRLVQRLSMPSYERELARSVHEGHPLVEMVVIPQNRHIGHRNVHYLKPGAAASVGSGGARFLIYFVPVPRRMAQLRYDGHGYSFVPLRSELFPGTSGTVPDCLGKGIPARSLHGYRFTIIFRRFTPPLEEINRLMRSTRTGAPKRFPPAKG